MVVALAPLEQPSSSASPAEQWNLAQRIVFRFGFVYLFLYCFPFPIGSLPKTEWLSESWQKLWWEILPWVGEDLLGLDKVAVGPNGSGDTTADYLWVLCYLVVAAVATIAWTLLDRRRPSYRTLLHLLRIYLRYTLAFIIMGYGMVKVLPSQFGTPTPGTLLETYGESSPMRLLWTFMGGSMPYTVFSGACEVIGGALLLWRRTTLLGALFLLGVIGNVLMLNLCYDVPVKLFSAHLLGMAIFLAAPHGPRLFDFFVRNRATAPADLGPVPRGRRALLAARTGKGVLIALLAYQTCDGAYESYTTWGAGAPAAKHAGIWKVESTDGSWKLLGISSRGWTVKDTADERSGWKVDWRGDTAILTGYQSQAVLVVHVAPTEEGGLVISGAINATLAPDAGKHTQLIDRGFRWINEYPHNR